MGDLRIDAYNGREPTPPAGQKSMETCIRYYDDVLSSKFCEDVIERFECAEGKQRGLTFTKANVLEYDKSHKDTMELVVSDDPKWRSVEEVLTKTYLEYIQRYIYEFNPLLAVGQETHREEFRIKKYEVGGLFNWHIDCSGENYYRLLAIQFYFNDVHEGGETEFEYQQTGVKPKRGRVIIFPTTWTYRHRGAPVISNAKYVCTNYLRVNPGSSAST